MKRISAIVAAALMLLSFLTLFSCSKKESSQKPEETPPDETVQRITIAKDGKTDYKIVYPAGFTNREKVCAGDLQSYIEKIAGVRPEVVTDAEPEGKYEILIGNTSRGESSEAKSALEGCEYLVKAVGEKLVMLSEKEKNYDNALNYFKYNCAAGGEVFLPLALEYRGQEITIFTADEKIAGKTNVDIKITPYSKDTRAGIFVGKEDKDSLYGYAGYCVLVEKGNVTMYEMGKTLEVMASRNVVKSLKAGVPFSMRLFVNQGSIAAYYLDDAEGVEPWPEIELMTNRNQNCSVGFIEISGTGATYSDLSVTPVDSTVKGAKYTNAIYAGYADPDVYFENGTYYLYATGGSGYRVHTSTDLVNWKAGGIVVTPNLWGETKWYWAPDVEKIGDKYYMVVSCNESIGIAVADSPTGPFKEHSKNILYRKSIDGHLFVDDDGKIYLYFVSWRSTYGIYGVELDKDLNPISKTEKLLITATAAWEQDMGSVTEGPFMLKKDGVYYLTYSGSHYQSEKYAVGYATSKSPLGNYKKYNLSPIMVGNTQIHGTGHHCITTSPSGNEMIIVYHCHNTLTEVETRRLCIDRIRFAPVEGDIDRLEVYGPSVIPQLYPQ